MDTEWTIDRLADLNIKQSRQGFRFGMDAVLLATDLPSLPPNPKILELGAGQGTVSLGIARQLPECEVWALERQESLFELLCENIEKNGLGAKVHAMHADLRQIKDLLPSHSMDLVVSNPPFYKVGEGLHSPNDERANAHSEFFGGLQDFIDAARYALKPRGRMKVVLPPRRLNDLFECVQGTDLGLETLRWLHPRAGEPAYLFEAVLRRNSKRTLEVQAPLVIHEGDGFTLEIQNRLELRCGSFG